MSKLIFIIVLVCFIMTIVGRQVGGRCRKQGCYFRNRFKW